MRGEREEKREGGKLRTLLTAAEESLSGAEESLPTTKQEKEIQWKV